MLFLLLLSVVRNSASLACWWLMDSEIMVALNCWMETETSGAADQLVEAIEKGMDCRCHVSWEEGADV